MTKRHITQAVCLALAMVAVSAVMGMGGKVDIADINAVLNVMLNK